MKTENEMFTGIINLASSCQIPDYDGLFSYTMRTSPMVKMGSADTKTLFIPTGNQTKKQFWRHSKY